MSDTVALEAREGRLLRLTQQAKRLNKEALVQTLAIAEKDRNRLRTALNIYLWMCLSEAFPDKNYPLSDDMLRDYEQDLLALPNITPNGLILPKRENILAFNLLQRETSAAFRASGMSGAIARVQYPVNVRLQSGVSDPVKDNRPRASVKVHSDIWAGDPAAGILVFIVILGDPSKSGIRFFKPTHFPKSYVRTLEDFNEGLPLTEGMEELTPLDKRGWFLADSYALHQTTRNGVGTRLSLEFRFIPSMRVDSDIDEDGARKPFFTSFEEWMQMGASKWITTQEGLWDFAPDRSKEPYTVGYPVKISLTEMEPSDEVVNRTKAVRHASESNRAKA